MLLSIPWNSIGVMNLDEPRSVSLRLEQSSVVLHHAPPSRLTSQLRDPEPKPLRSWYAGGLPSKQTAPFSRAFARRVSLTSSAATVGTGDRDNNADTARSATVMIRGAAAKPGGTGCDHRGAVAMAFATAWLPGGKQRRAGRGLAGRLWRRGKCEVLSIRGME